MDKLELDKFIELFKSVRLYSDRGGNEYLSQDFIGWKKNTPLEIVISESSSYYKIPTFDFMCLIF